MAEEKNNQAPAANVEIIGVNFREAGKIYYFAPMKHKLCVNDYVIVETSRGVEIGRVKIANKIISSKEITSPLKGILRPATKDDINQHQKNNRM